MSKSDFNIMRYAGLATQWMVLLLLGVYGGYRLDNYLHLSIPVFLILFPLVALVVSLVGLIKEVSKK